MTEPKALEPINVQGLQIKTSFDQDRKPVVKISFNVPAASKEVKHIVEILRLYAESQVQVIFKSLQVPLFDQDQAQDPGSGQDFPVSSRDR